MIRYRADVQKLNEEILELDEVLYGMEKDVEVRGMCVVGLVSALPACRIPMCRWLIHHGWPITSPHPKQGQQAVWAATEMKYKRQMTAMRKRNLELAEKLKEVCV